MDANAKTLKVYKDRFQEYALKTPIPIMGAMKNWLDDAVYGLPFYAEILEIGSGTGRDSDYIARKGYYPYRSDACLSAVAYIKSTGRSCGIFNVVTDNLYEKYDLILANAVFLHLTGGQFCQAIRKCANALTHDGRLAFTLKVGSGEDWVTSKMTQPRYFHYWQATDVFAHLHDIGFTNINIVEAEGWLHVIASKV